MDLDALSPPTNCRMKQSQVPSDLINGASTSKIKVKREEGDMEGEEDMREDKAETNTDHLKDMICWNCKEKGHFAKDCSTEWKEEEKAKAD
ncbi:hypothetical protein SRHO_G00248090 [Serrasalmus rhombeus]